MKVRPMRKSEVLKSWADLVRSTVRMICHKCRQREASKRPAAYGWCVPCAFTFLLSSTRWASGNTPEAREKWTAHATPGAEARESTEAH